MRSLEEDLNELRKGNKALNARWVNMENKISLQHYKEKRKPKIQRGWSQCPETNLCRTPKQVLFRCTQKIETFEIGREKNYNICCWSVGIIKFIKMSPRVGLKGILGRKEGIGRAQGYLGGRNLKRLME